MISKHTKDMHGVSSTYGSKTKKNRFSYIVVSKGYEIKSYDQDINRYASISYENIIFEIFFPNQDGFEGAYIILFFAVYLRL